LQTIGADDRNPWLVPAAVLGGCLLFGLVVGGWVLGAQIKDIKLADRYVTVKGLVEKTVKSDMAIWPVSFKETGNDLPQVFAKSQADNEAVLKGVSISAADSISTGEEGGGDSGDASMMKKVRVVATVDYYLVR
jgi:hypothetical protein